MISNWISGELFGLLNQVGASIEDARVSPEALAELLKMVAGGEINQNTAKNVLAEMFTTGKTAELIVAERALRQISDAEAISEMVERVLEENPNQVAEYLGGKEPIAKWLFGQVMRATKGKANPQVVEQELNRKLEQLKN
jgi:aspartyl-tRNA(Asn)/glutamyl-tRNA(Gln) amidotransferase subunit B